MPDGSQPRVGPLEPRWLDDQASRPDGLVVVVGHEVVGLVVQLVELQLGRHQLLGDEHVVPHGVRGIAVVRLER